MTLAIPSYPKVWAVGSPAVATIFSHGDEIVVQEKVDGSQISFGKIDGELVMRSKGQPLYAANPDGMFKLGVEAIVAVADEIPPDTIFRGEYLNRPRHNTLAYNRVPKNHIVIFDVQHRNVETLEWEYGTRIDVEAFTELLGFDVVPELARGVIEKPTDLTDLLERESFLGGPKIEGFVVKNYARLTRFGDQMLAKYVSPAFKEKHTKDWKNRNPTGKDFVGLLSDEFATPARFAKGVQHLRERGQITGEARDIGPLMKELAEDLVAEHKDYILERLWSQFGKDIVRGTSRGAPGIASIKMPLQVVSVVGDQLDVSTFTDEEPVKVLGEVAVIAASGRFRLSVAPWKFDLGPVPTVGDTITVTVTTRWEQPK